MSFQTLQLLSNSPKSISAAFAKQEQREVLQRLLKDLVDLRNVVDGMNSSLKTYATGTVTFASAASGDDIAVGATTFVATSGAVTPGAATYQYDAASDALVKASFIAQVNAHAVASTKVTASSGGTAIALLTAVTDGVTGNSIVLTSVDGVTTAVSGSGTLAGADLASALTGPAAIQTTL